MRRVHWIAADRHCAGQKFNHGVAENVIAISRNHVAGVCDIDVVTMRA